MEQKMATLSCSRRFALGAALIWSTGAIFLGGGHAAPLDSIPIDRGTKILKQGRFAIPAASGGTEGVVGTEVVIPNRGFFGIDFAVDANKELTLMLVTEAQKNAMSAGGKLNGDPLVRIPIEAVASHTVRLSPGRYHMFFLNSDSSQTQVFYRTSLQPF
jgi:hypothetical protein